MCTVNGLLHKATLTPDQLEVSSWKMKTILKPLNILGTQKKKTHLNIFITQKKTHFHHKMNKAKQNINICLQILLADGIGRGSLINLIL